MALHSWSLASPLFSLHLRGIQMSHFNICIVLSFHEIKQCFPYLVIIHISVSFPLLAIFSPTYNICSWTHFAKMTSSVYWGSSRKCSYSSGHLFFFFLLLSDQALDVSLWKSLAVALGLHTTRFTPVFFGCHFEASLRHPQHACWQTFNSNGSSLETAVLSLTSKPLKCSHSQGSLKL